MKNSMFFKSIFKKIAFLFFVVCTTGLYSQTVHISANDTNILFSGVLYPIKSADSVVLNRHSLDFFDKTEGYFKPKMGRTQSGIVVSFKSSSPTLTVNFKKRVDAQNNAPFFAVYKNNVFQNNVTTISFDLQSNTNEEVTWDIVLPSHSGVHFLGLDLQNGYSLVPLGKQKKKKYIAIGDSITHGNGLVNAASDGAYPFIIASKLGYTSYNLAVGASRITPLIADETTPIKADLITVLWGFNDWNSNKDMTKLSTDYTLLLTKLRAYHPKAKIYCIMPITTTVLSPKYGGTPIYGSIDILRDTERSVVQNLIKAGDKKMFLIEGGDLTTEADLRDGIHLSNEGAASFAEKLIPILK
jgi:lysophospholipase L1-like esterase